MNKPLLFVIPLFNERKNIMTDYSPCQNCAFHNPKAKYGCEMTDEIPVICSVKMRKMKQEKLRVKYES